MSRFQFIENWKIIWFRRWSTWLAAIYAAFSAAVLAQPAMLFGLINLLPSHTKTLMAGGTFIILFGLPVLVSLLSQPKLQEKVAEKVAEKAEEAKNAAPDQ